MAKKHTQKKLTIEGSSSFDSTTDETFLPSDHLDVPNSAVFRQPRRTPSGKWKRTASDTGIRRISFKDETILHAAVMDSDNREIWKVLTKSPKLSINLHMKNGLAPLHQCVLNKNVDGVKILLWFQADPDVADSDGYTCLHWASVCGYIDIASMLLVHQANLFAQTPDGEMPIDLALDAQILRFLYDEMISQTHSKLLIESCIEFYFWDFLHRLYDKLCYFRSKLVEWFTDFQCWIKETYFSSNNERTTENHVKYK